MDVRRIAAAAAIPCLCLLAADADAQTRRSAYRTISFELRPSAPPIATDQRVEELADRTPGHSGMIESVVVGANAEVGIGRYAVGPIARPRSNMERERMLERENRNIAGAGMRLRF